MEKKTYKDSLLKYLCMALPYGVMMDEFGQAKKLVGFHPFEEYCVELDNGEYMPQLYTIEECKPYLRPMSSMTREEEEEYAFLLNDGGWGVSEQLMINCINWLLENHFDFMGLIPMDCAIEVTKDNNPYKD